MKYQLRENHFERNVWPKNTKRYNGTPKCRMQYAVLTSETLGVDFGYTYIKFIKVNKQQIHSAKSS